MTPRGRTRRPSNRFASALVALERSLDRLDIPSAVIGGIAINANGVARFTEDIDATIPGAGLDLARVVGAFAKDRIGPRTADAVGFARRNQVLLLHHAPSGIDLDISLAWMAFELEAIEHAVELKFGATRIRAARPEDLLIYKLIANRPQDVSDAERLLLLHVAGIDLDRVRRILGDLTEHLDGPDRAAILRRLLARVPISARTHPVAITKPPARKLPARGPPARKAKRTSRSARRGSTR